MSESPEQVEMMGGEGDPTGDPRAFSVVMVGVVGGIIFVATVIAVAALFYFVDNEELERKVYTAELPLVRAQKAEQLADLSSYHWIDEKKGVVAIPIDQAMQRVVRAQAAAQGG